MKKLFLSLFVAGALTFGLQSCGDDPVEECTSTSCPQGQSCVDGTCVTDVVTCDVCGIYNGDASGSIVINLTGTDTTFSDLPVSAEVTQNPTPANSYNMAVDISTLLGAAPGTLVPDVDGTLAGNTITITNQNYNYQGIASIDIDGTVVFDAAFANLDGSLTLSGAAVGSMTFTGVKQ